MSELIAGAGDPERRALVVFATHTAVFASFAFRICVRSHLRRSDEIVESCLVPEMGVGLETTEPVGRDEARSAGEVHDAYIQVPFADNSLGLEAAEYIK